MIRSTAPRSGQLKITRRGRLALVFCIASATLCAALLLAWGMAYLLSPSASAGPVAAWLGFLAGLVASRVMRGRP